MEGVFVWEHRKEKSKFLKDFELWANGNKCWRAVLLNTVLPVQTLGLQTIPRAHIEGARYITILEPKMGSVQRVASQPR